MTLSVVYVPDTGHVVGAVGVTGELAPGTVAALVGPALPLRVRLEDETAVLTLQSRRLAALAADDEPGVFADPLAFGVDQVVGGDQTVPPKPVLLTLQPLTTPLVLDSEGLLVALPEPDLTKDTAVLVLLSDGPDTRVLPGTIAQGQSSTIIRVSVDDGTYGVLVLVAGWAGRLEPVTKQ